jgi:hypothetical protein
MTVQTTVTAPALGQAGDLYDAGPARIHTFIALEAIPFGKYVNIAGTTVELPDSEAEVISGDGGIALRDPIKATGAGYAAGDAVAVLIEGMCWVPVENAVTQFGAAYVRHTAAGAEVKGSFRSDADGTDADPAPGAKYWTASSGGLAVVAIGQVGPRGATGPTG